MVLDLVLDLVSDFLRKNNFFLTRAALKIPNLTSHICRIYRRGMHSLWRRLEKLEVIELERDETVSY
ncbi:MAG: hypothetical protein N3F06_04240, partial [Nitrososphaerales archaeon]|nr:hypothetical protein [Nitrososphaerales archaeon]